MLGKDFNSRENTDCDFDFSLTAYTVLPVVFSTREDKKIMKLSLCILSTLFFTNQLTVKSIVIHYVIPFLKKVVCAILIKKKLHPPCIIFPHVPGTKRGDLTNKRLRERLVIRKLNRVFAGNIFG